MPRDNYLDPAYKPVWGYTADDIREGYNAMTPSNYLDAAKGYLGSAMANLAGREGEAQRRMQNPRTAMQGAMESPMVNAMGGLAAMLKLGMGTPKEVYRIGKTIGIYTGHEPQKGYHIFDVLKDPEKGLAEDNVLKGMKIFPQDVEDFLGRTDTYSWAGNTKGGGGYLGFGEY